MALAALRTLTIGTLDAHEDFISRRTTEAAIFCAVSSFLLALFVTRKVQLQRNRASNMDTTGCIMKLMTLLPVVAMATVAGHAYGITEGRMTFSCPPPTIANPFPPNA